MVQEDKQNVEDDVAKRILDAGEMLFSEKGYAATSVRDITSMAECNVAAVNYHFGGKEKLYAAVLIRYLDYLRDSRLKVIDEVTAGDYTLEDLVRNFSRVFLETMGGVSGKAMPFRLIIREKLDPVFEDNHREFVKRINQIRERMLGAVKNLYPNVSDELVGMAMHSLVGQLFHFNHIVSEHQQDVAIHLGSPDVDRAVEFITRFTVAGMREVFEGAKGAEGANR